MKRHGDWETRLNDYLKDVRFSPHEYGQHDCILHSMAAVRVQTGEDPAEPARGRYKTEIGAMRVLRRVYGVDSVAEALDKFFDQIPVASAKRGDIVLFDGSAGVVYGGFALFVGEENEVPGLVQVPRTEWEKAWSVG